MKIDKDIEAREPPATAEDDNLNLLLSSVPPPPIEEDEADESGAVIHASTISGLEHDVAENGTALVESMRRSQGSIRLKAGLGVVLIALLGVGAVSWARSGGGDEPGVEAAREAEELSQALSVRDQELLAMRAAHLEEIEAIQSRLAELRERGAAEDGAAVEALVTRLEESRAESAEVALAALEDPPGADRRRRSRARDAVGTESVAGAAEPPKAGSGVDENPYGEYDGVTSATGLNNLVWQPATKPKVEPEPAPAPAGPANEIEELLASAVPRPSERARPTPGPSRPISDALPDTSLPDKPTRQQVRQVMERLASHVKRCGGEAYSRLTVQVEVAGETGRVTKARTIDGDYRGTAVGSCAARAVRAAKFPRFAREQLSIKYPFDL